MTDWVLIPCLQTLFDEFDKIAPNRDHASDGKIGDAAHQAEVSDHNPDETGNVPIHDSDKINEVHAIDVDDNLNQDDFDMEDVVQYILSECRKSNDVGLDRGRLRYIIYYRRIWEAKNGWVERPYTGSSPHTEHAHFSAEYDTNYESDTRTWGLIERFGFMDKATLFSWLDEYYKKFAKTSDGSEVSPLGQLVIDHQWIPSPLNPDRAKSPLYDVLNKIQQNLINKDKVSDEVQDQLAEIIEMLSELTPDKTA